MQIEVIPQVEIGNVQRIRIGDVLNAGIASEDCRRFRFAVAYMRVSGLDRLWASVGSLLNRGGHISGAVGIDDGITTVEALEMLRQVSADSTIFHTVSGYIYHPKLYLMEQGKSAVALVGSANLTRDGLFRNVELATAVHMDLDSGLDCKVYERYNNLLNELLDTGNPNVQPVDKATLKGLIRARVLKREAEIREPGPPLRSRRTRQGGEDLQRLFPPLRVPVAPPASVVTTRPHIPGKARLAPVIPPATIGIAATFVLQLSAFDCSHRTGIRGTPEILVPHAAISFFPELSAGGRKYPDALFDVILNTPTGRERRQYRLWYYEERAVGTRIDEYRLRLDHDSIDMTTIGGGDLLVINKLPYGSDPAYEVTILPQTDPTFPSFLAMCKLEAQGKKWGMETLPFRASTNPTDPRRHAEKS